jgi:flagellar assembly protein FliH
MLESNAPERDVGMQAAAAPKAFKAVGMSDTVTKEDLDALRQCAQAEGLAEGRLAAQAELRAGLERQARQWADGLASIEQAVDARLQALHTTAVSVAFEAIAHVLGQAYRDHQGVVRAVNQVISQLPSVLDIRVAVHPEAADAVRLAVASLTPSPGRHVAIEPDASLAMSACRISTERGTLETDLALQLRAIADALLSAHLQHAEAAR